MTLTEQYDLAESKGLIQQDCFQRQMLPHFQRVIDELNQTSWSWFGLRPRQSVTGIYLHGPVGVGKTYLMDLFYQHLEISNKARFHFHQFMQRVDAALRRLQGHQDPLRRVASDVAKKTRLLCLDEFFVHDIADAMMLAELLRALFAKGVVLVVTSNIPPDALYRDGLQRARFLPAIELIKAHCQVLALEERQDYRLGRPLLKDTYFYPLTDETEQALKAQFQTYAIGVVEQDGVLMVQNRPIPFIKCSQGTVWFSFDVICNIPRSPLDYLELATRFDTILISDMPKLGPQDTVRALLLMHLIDVMYDKGVRVIFSAAVPLQELYETGSKRAAFQRTVSRLYEMQSTDYLPRHPYRGHLND